MKIPVFPRENPFLAKIDQKPVFDRGIQKICGSIESVNFLRNYQTLTKIFQLVKKHKNPKKRVAMPGKGKDGF